jgi:hypothetical protein
MPDDTPKNAATATISDDLATLAEHLADTARDLALRYFQQGVEGAGLAGRQVLATANPALHEQALTRLDPTAAS